MKPRITFLVSVFDRPLNLLGLLGSLIVQTDQKWEAVVLNNGMGVRASMICDEISEYARNQIEYYHTANNKTGWDCYWSSDLAIEKGWANGDYLAFASDDGYYVPEFVQVMCDAADENQWDFAYCDLLYDARAAGKRSIMTAYPQCCSIDKTNFIVRRDKWIGFATKNTGPFKPTQADGEAVEEMVRRGYRHGRVDQVLAVHS
jgi:glycosyltransferase involved in cell wall biosynthesis